MTATGVRRPVCLSFLGVSEGRHRLSVLGRYVVAPILLRHVAADHVEKEQIIRDSGLGWTIIRAPRLTDGPRTGTYRHGETIHARQIVPLARRPQSSVGSALLREGRRFKRATEV